MEENAGLAKVLQRKEVLTLAFGSMIGWGWVMLANSWLEAGGFLGAIIAFSLSAVMCALVGLAYAELATSLPLAGGEFVYAYRALGRSWAWLAGWAIAFAYVGLVAFEGVAFVTAVDYLVRIPRVGFLWEIAGEPVYLSWAMIGILTGGLLCYFNYRGIKQAATFQNWATAILAVGGVLFVTAGAFLGSPANFGPLFTTGSGMITVLLMGPALFLGFGVIPQVAEEIDLPRQVVGKLLVFSIVLAALWYVIIILGMGLSVPPELRRTYEIPVADAMAKLLRSRAAGGLVIVAGIAGIITTWNAFIIAASRILYAMGRARMLPPIFGTLHARFRTPAPGIILVFLVGAISPLLGRQALLWFLNASSLGCIIAYIMVALSMLALKKREPGLPRPYAISMPLGVVALLIALAFFFLFLPFSPAALTWQEWIIVFAWALIGAVLTLAARTRARGLTESEREELIFGKDLARNASPIPAEAAQANERPIIGPDNG